MPERGERTGAGGNERKAGEGEHQVRAAGRVGATGGRIHTPVIGMPAGRLYGAEISRADWLRCGYGRPVEGGVSAARPEVLLADRAERAVEFSDSSEAWLRHALEEIVTQIHRLLDLTGCAFLVVDWKRRYITSAAAWFESDPVRDAFGGVLSRPYEPERAGLTEASIEAGGPLLLADFESWPGADGLRTRLEERLDPDTARLVYDWYRSSSFMAVPGAHARRPHAGRADGGLERAAPAAPGAGPARRSRSSPTSPGSRSSAPSASPTRQARAEEERLLNHATQEVSRSLELDEVYRAIVSQAVRLTGAVEGHARAASSPRRRELRTVASTGFSDRVARSRISLGDGMIGRVAGPASRT